MVQGRNARCSGANHKAGQEGKATDGDQAFESGQFRKGPVFTFAGTH